MTLKNINIPIITESKYIISTAIGSNKSLNKKCRYVDMHMTDSLKINCHYLCPYMVVHLIYNKFVKQDPKICLTVPFWTVHSIST